MSKDLSNLQASLNYHFNNEALLLAALTHRSVRGANNERLEFLGDSIVNFIIAHATYHQFPKASEGELSRLRASLVKGETLAKMAQEFQVGSYLRLGAGEIKTGGAQRASILADAMEAIIGAIYLDSDFMTCRNLVLSWFEPRLAIPHDEDLKDPKTRLQELLQARKMPLPVYSVVKVEGEAHEQVFHIQCEIEGQDNFMIGKGTSKRKAEQIAAKLWLTYFESKTDD